jgi:hypothetical protein
MKGSMQPSGISRPSTALIFTLRSTEPVGRSANCTAAYSRSTSLLGRLIPALTEGHQVIGVGLRGHGHTVDVDRPMSLEDLAADVASLLDHLAIAEAEFIGFVLAAWSRSSLHSGDPTWWARW